MSEHIANTLTYQAPIPEFYVNKFTHRLTHALIPQRTQRNGDALVSVRLKTGEDTRFVYDGPMTRRAAYRLLRRLLRKDMKGQRTVAVMISISL